MTKRDAITPPVLSLDTARDAAQQIVTACLHGDRSTAVDIATEYPDGTVLALVLADLVAYTHHRWSEALGIPRSEAWTELMADVEEWRVSCRG